MRDDNYISSKRDIRNRRYRQRRRQVILNRFILSGVLLILVLLGVIAGVNACRNKAGNDEKGGKATGGHVIEESTTDETTDTKPPVTGEDDTTEPATDETEGNNTGEAYKKDGKRIVCIDPGHGGEDGGSVGADGVLEKDDNLKMALALRTALENKGITVYMTRDDDSWVNLKDRPKLANSKNADLLVSIHRNEYAADTGVRGFETWIHSSKPPAVVDLATRIQAALTAAGITRDRGVKYGSQGSEDVDLAVNNHSNGPSCLLEMGFMTNAEDNSVFRNNTNALAAAMADAIVEWMNAQGL